MWYLSGRLTHRRFTHILSLILTPLRCHLLNKEEDVTHAHHELRFCKTLWGFTKVCPQTLWNTDAAGQRWNCWGAPMQSDSCYFSSAWQERQVCVCLRSHTLTRLNSSSTPKLPLQRFSLLPGCVHIHASVYFSDYLPTDPDSIRSAHAWPSSPHKPLPQTKQRGWALHFEM